MRDYLMMAAALAVLAIGGILLSQAQGIDLGWKTSRMTPEYRRTVRSAAQAATENGAIHTLDAKRNLMRIDIGTWGNQSTEMRLSLLRLASRHFQLEGDSGHVDVRGANSDRQLATFDGGNQFQFMDTGKNPAGRNLALDSASNRFE